MLTHINNWEELVPDGIDNFGHEDTPNSLIDPNPSACSFNRMRYI